jgi:predicted RNase H-like HicB family nuclease
MPHKYELFVFWSSDDDAFVVEVPDLPGCMAHGTTPADAVAEAEQAIDLWIETARDLGRPIPEPSVRALNQVRRG